MFLFSVLRIEATKKVPIRDRVVLNSSMTACPDLTVLKVKTNYARVPVQIP